MRISKKATLYILLGCIVGVFLVIELTKTNDNHSLFQFTVAPEASIHHPYQDLLETWNPYQSMSLPTALTQSEVQKWEAFHQEDENIGDTKAIPEALIQINDSLNTVGENPSYLALDFDFKVPLRDLIPYSEDNVEQDTVTFKTEGVWIANHGREKSLYLTGSVPDFDQKFINQHFHSQDTISYMNYSPLHIVLTQGPGESFMTSGSSFQTTYLIRDGENIYFFLETNNFRVDAQLTAPLQEEMDIYLEFRSTFDLSTSSPLVVPLKRSLGEEFQLSGRTLSLSPGYRVRFEKLLRYDDFILFEAAFQQTTEHEIVSHAYFDWSTGDETYRAESIYSPDKGKMLFVTNDRLSFENTDNITIKTFTSNFHYDFEAKIPLAKLEPGPLISFHGWTIEANYIENSTNRVPNISVSAKQEEVQKPPSNFSIKSRFGNSFRLVGSPSKNELNDIIYTASYDSWEGPESLYFRFSPVIDEHGNIEIEEQDIQLEDYEFELILPPFWSEFSSDQVDLSLGVRKTGNYYEPR
ncbi:hypothetical protein [Bacillus horti]|uniref:Regulatory protein YycH domain-containing protein n=1 Tax=Caldalkalibacillus horti TaxID=77523 RepID=A0ABT9W4F7_9BACI|nr:hypothetical protein [Bacillus horti]MDQ0168133.1 hypothetical protein [Bacillus horti]